jgi:hypothetical protein
MKRQSFLKLSTLLGFMIPTVSTARAADVVSWDDLPRKIGHGKVIFTLDFAEGNHEDRAYTVVTTSGEKVRFSAMSIDSRHLWGAGHDIPGNRVSEVRIHHKGQFADPLTEAFRGGIFLCGHLACNEVGLVGVIPVAIGYGVVSTVPLIAVEGIRRLFPAKVIKVTH